MDNHGKVDKYISTDMSISKRIAESVDKMVAGDAESALIPVSIAVDATASKVYPNKNNNQAYKDWIHDNLSLITKVGIVLVQRELDKSLLQLRDNLAFGKEVFLGIAKL